MTELEKAARQALEQLEFLNACYPHKTAADAITALTQALATSERKGEPAKSLVIQCPMCSDFDPDAACHFCSLLSVHDVEEWRNAVVIAKPVPNTGMVPVKARTILAVDRLIANAVAAQAQPTNTSPQVPEGFALVPVEPTPEMKSAGIKVEVYSEVSDSIGVLTWGEVRAIYRAMLDAARKGEKS